MTRSGATLLFSLLLCSTAGASAAQYRADVDMSHPQLVRMSLVVPNANAGSRTLVLRGVAWGLEP
jgi:hypothetical protein